MTDRSGGHPPSGPLEASTSGEASTPGEPTGPDESSSATGTAAAPSIEALRFDAALAEFQRVVAALESGGQPLEDALALYERGMLLQAHLDRLLTDAELRIRRLVERSGGRLETVQHSEDSPEA